MKQEIELAVQAACKELFDADVAPELTRPDEQFGDFASNVALQLAKKLGKNPREVAEAITVNAKEKLGDKLADAQIAGPGFINFTLSDAALAASVQAEAVMPLAAKTILVEYSDPNPFKPLHAGHLYTTLVGDTIARLVEHAGANVTRLNYSGDVGRHVGISMWAILRQLQGEHPEMLQDILPADRPAWLGARYVEGTAAFEDDAAAKAEILETNKRVYQLHEQNDHESPFAQIYWTCRQWSYDYFKTLYDQLQVRPFDRYIPESEVTPLGVETVKEQLQKGVYKESDGAVVFEGEPYGLHTRVFINSEGLPTYEAKDVGLMLTKWQDYHYDRSYYITASEQAQYFQVVFKSIEQFLPEATEHAVSMTHGVVKLQGGVKMSSRKGNVVTALEILEAAREAGKETGTNPSEDTILAAVKYAFAKNRIGGDIVYDPKESIALEGNSGPYLQYAHARARSILAKASARGADGEQSEPGEGGLHPSEAMDAPEKVRTVSDSAQGGLPGQASLPPRSHGPAESGRPPSRQGLSDLQPPERNLLRKLTEYPEAVEKATAELMPHHICTYLYELAQAFNRFYEHNRVIGDEREAERLQLVTLYADRLKAGLELLGITAPNQM